MGALSDFPVSRPLMYIYLLLLQCFCLNSLFFSKKNRVIISYFRFELRLPLSRTTVTWWEYCRYGVKHTTINQSFVGEGLWSILLHTLKCYSKPILDPNTFNMLNISLPVSKNMHKTPVKFWIKWMSRYALFTWKTYFIWVNIQLLLQISYQVLWIFAFSHN